MVKRFFGVLVATALAGCGGGGGGASSISVAPSPQVGGNEGSGPDPIDEETVVESILSSYEQQVSVITDPPEPDPDVEIYDPDTESTVKQTFVQATVAEPKTRRKERAYLIATSFHGIAQAARDLIAGIGVQEDAYSFVDTSGKDTSNRSAYLNTQENSIVNIQFNPLYARQGSGLASDLLIGPDDISSHGWIVSDTGSDGNIDPIAGITGREWLSAYRDDIAAGYRQALATGKVRLFYGLDREWIRRHPLSNGCQGFERYCLGAPYSLKVKNKQGIYKRVEGSFVSTYGFAAYVMAWERLPEDTHVSEVFKLGDECAEDLGLRGADADTGLGRLDVGCMAGRVYEISVVSVTVESTLDLLPTITVGIDPETSTTVTIGMPDVIVPEPSPTITVVIYPETSTTVTIGVPESAVTTVVPEPSATITVEIYPETSTTTTISVPEAKATITVVIYPETSTTVTIGVPESTVTTSIPEPRATIIVEIDPETSTKVTIGAPEATVTTTMPEPSPTITVVIYPETSTTVTIGVPESAVTTAVPEPSATITVEIYPETSTTTTISVPEAKATITVVIYPETSTTVTIGVPESTVTTSIPEPRATIIVEIDPETSTKVTIGAPEATVTTTMPEPGPTITVVIDPETKTTVTVGVPDATVTTTVPEPSATITVVVDPDPKMTVTVSMPDATVTTTMPEPGPTITVVIDPETKTTVTVGVPDATVTTTVPEPSATITVVVDPDPKMTVTVSMPDATVTTEVPKTTVTVSLVVTPENRISISIRHEEDDDFEEVYDPKTRSSIAQAFALANLENATASRQNRAYLVASSTYGIGEVAMDLIFGIGLKANAYSFLDTGSDGASNRSAYLSTQENSLVNILSDPLYTSGTERASGSLLNPGDMGTHGWVVSDTGFDGNIDPIAGITGRSGLRARGTDIAAGYRQALATGKVRLFYGLAHNGQERHRSSNGCKGIELYCLGTPYSLRIKNAQGRYIDVEGAFVSTYGFAAYVMAWERMPEDTHISEVFDLGDECAHDLGSEGADADTGRGRLDVGCMADRIYQASIVSVTVSPPTVTVSPPTVTVSPPTVTVSPPTVTVSPPTVTVSPPTVTVSPPTVTVSPPTVTVSPPTVTVSPPTVTVSPPTVTVSPPTVTVLPPRPITVVITTMLPLVTVSPPLITVSLQPITVPPLPTTDAPPIVRRWKSSYRFLLPTVTVVTPTVTKPPNPAPGSFSLSLVLIRKGVTDNEKRSYFISHTRGEPSQYWINFYGRRFFPAAPYGYWMYIQMEDIYYDRISDSLVTYETLSQGSWNTGGNYKFTWVETHVGGINYESIYLATQENSLVNFLFNPVFLDDRGKRAMSYGYDIWLDPKYINEHGWIVTGTGYDWFKHRPSVSSPFLFEGNLELTRSGYFQALATGKVRLFYPLRPGQTSRSPILLNNWGHYNCHYFKEYCIGVPYGFESGHPRRTNLSAAYAFGVYQAAWGLMPAHTHISEVFAIGDRCTEDIGKEGPDNVTGLGRLDVGCMAREAYKANVVVDNVTLSVVVVPGPEEIWRKNSLADVFDRLGFKGAHYRDRNAYVIGHERSVRNSRTYHNWDPYYGLRASPLIDRHSAALLGRPDQPDGLLSAMGMSTRYTFLNAAETVQADYQSMYKTTPENSLVHFNFNPIYLYGPEAVDRFASFGGDEMAITPESIEDHGWIVSGVRHDSLISGYPDTEKIRGDLAEGYGKALATGKVRLFYGYLSPYLLFVNNWKRQGCEGLEKYCIGAPSRYSVGDSLFDLSSEDTATYGFGVYLTTWEKMPVATHISAIFAMGDRCALDVGRAGPDAVTGLGRLDIGCMASEAYRMNLDSLAATLSVATEAGNEPPQATVALAAGKNAKTYWDTTNRPETLAEDFARLGVAAAASRKSSAYVVAHAGYDTSWKKRFLWMGTSPSLCRFRTLDYYVCPSWEREWIGPVDAANSRFDYLLDLHIGQMGKNIRYTEGLLSAMGLAGSYTFLDAGQAGMNYEKVYATTPENSLVHFEVNPIYADSDGKDAFSLGGEEIVLDPESVKDHGWIVSGTGHDVALSIFSGITDVYWLRYYSQEELQEGYRKALATGKVRLFYGLNENQSRRTAGVFNGWGQRGCAGFEEYCIGVPYGAKYGNGMTQRAASYGYGVYLAAWERMPAAAHISAVFALGDRCTEDMGTTGPDADTGLGRLDIGCVAHEVYKVRLNPSATLSVAARVMPAAPAASVALSSVVAGNRKNRLLIVRDMPTGLSYGLSQLGVTVVTRRKQNAYVIGHSSFDLGSGTAAFLESWASNPWNYFDHHGNYFLKRMGRDISYTRGLLASMGLTSAASYSFLDAAGPVSVGYESLYRSTPENSMVHFEINPLYLDGAEAKAAFSPEAEEIGIDVQYINNHGWIVSGAGYDSEYSHSHIATVSHYWFTENQAHLTTGYDKALATGKVRLFYSLDASQTVRISSERNGLRGSGCEGFESYCIGVPYGYYVKPSYFDYENAHRGSSSNGNTHLAAAYGYGVYLASWERMPAATHISVVFAMGDRCTEDMGAEGPDADTGLGRLDIGCMAGEVYKTHSSATVSNFALTIVIPGEEEVWRKNSLADVFGQLGFEDVNSRTANAYVIGHQRSVHNWDSYYGLRASPFIGRSSTFLLGRPDQPDGLLSAMGMSTGYTFLNAAGTAQADYQSMYKTTPENSLVHFNFNPIYLHGPEAVDRFASFGGEEVAITPESIKDHGWIVSGIRQDGRLVSVYRDTEKNREYLAEGYGKALATGKVRLFYGWDNSDEFFANNWNGQGCRGFEEYCIGTPARYKIGDSLFDLSSEDAATYGFGVYLTTWERMPAATHISAIFAMGDRCFRNTGEYDPYSGLLDIGCMANKAYEVNLNPSAATLSVAARAVIEPPKTTVALAAGKGAKTHWGTTNRPETLAEDFSRLGVAAAASRKSSAYVIAHAGHDTSWEKRFLWQWTATNLCRDNDCLVNGNFLGPDTANSRFNYLLDLHIGQMGKNIRYTENLLSAMGLAGSYTFLDAGQAGMNYEKVYATTPENSIVHFEVNPIYVDSLGVEEIVLDPDSVKDHGWIVSGAGHDVALSIFSGITDVYWLRYYGQKELQERYRKALATGKVRLFYGLNENQSRRAAGVFNGWGQRGCAGFEEYCIGVPYGAKYGNGITQRAASYGYGVYLAAWERLPAETHISAVFALGDRCTEDMGTTGPDADTGLGRLDIGCVAHEVYKVRLNPSAATLSVAARVMPAVPAASVVLSSVVAGNRKNRLLIVRDIPTGLSYGLSQLGVTVVARRKQNAYVIGHSFFDLGSGTAAFLNDWNFDRHGNYFLKRMGRDISYARSLLASMGLTNAASYSFLDAAGPVSVGYESLYRSTPENSIVHFEINPLYLDGAEAKAAFSPEAEEIGIDVQYINDHGWIVSGAGYDSEYSHSYIATVSHYWFTENQGHLATGYDKALATGKVRLFYSLDANQTVRISSERNGRGGSGCEGFESYCIGVPYGYYVNPSFFDFLNRHIDSRLLINSNGNTHFAAAYGYGIYLTSWERMPAATHISVVFAMGDRCTEDMGAEGPDADTGLGRLDIGCMAGEVYKTHSSATVSNFALTIVIPGEEEVWRKNSLADVFDRIRLEDVNSRTANAYVIGHERSVRSNSQAYHNWDSYYGLKTSEFIGRSSTFLLGRPDQPDGLLSAMEMSTGYTFLNAAGTAQADYQSMYKTTPENSLVHFNFNPIYLYGPEATDRFTSFGGDEVAITPESIKDHGWIVSGIRQDGRLVSVYRDTEENRGYLAEGYDKALATGKVRLFYGWDNSDEFFANNWNGQGCRGFEEYCIGTPARYKIGDSLFDLSSEDAATYGFGIYLTTWERMPAATHISAIFAMGDRCFRNTEEYSPYSGLLDIGCMANKAYEVNLNPSAATLSVAARAVIEPPQATVALAAGKDAKTHWGTTNRPETLAEDFSRLGVAAAASRKSSAYVVAHAGHATSWEKRFLWQWTAPRIETGPDTANSRFDYLLDLHIGQMGKNIKYTENLLSAMGLAGSYTFLDAGQAGMNYEKVYATTPENSIVHFEVNPIYVDSLGVEEIVLDPDSVKDHGWIVSGAGHDAALYLFSKITDVYWLRYYSQEELQERYRKALATGKIRLFYGLNASQSRRAASAFNGWGQRGCAGFEEYCIGVPYGAKYRNGITQRAASYGYGVYLAAWERMPEETHISAVFALGDRCTEDMGAAGADADTGLGRLDIGCVAHEVYKVRLNPSAATLSVAARVMPAAPAASVVLSVVAGKRKNTYWGTTGTPGTLGDDFARLGVTVVTHRKQNAYVIGHSSFDLGSGTDALLDGWNFDSSEWIHDHQNWNNYFLRRMGRDISYARSLLASMGLTNAASYSFLDAAGQVSVGYESLYRSTPENSIVHFEINPLYLDGAEAKAAFGPEVEEIGIDVQYINNHGWIVSGAGHDSEHSLSYLEIDSDSDHPDIQISGDLTLTITNLHYWFTGNQGHLATGYDKALATGKVRLFYSLDASQTVRTSSDINGRRGSGCEGFEAYCIGVPYGYYVNPSYFDYANKHRDSRFRSNGNTHLAAAYGYGVYLASWERLPAATHISVVFAMGDRCTEDMGTTGPDSDTGLGRLDIGCMAHEVYKVRLAEAATLSATALEMAVGSIEGELLASGAGSLQLASSGAGQGQLQAQSALSVAGIHDDPERQRFFDDFAQELFSDLGVLRLPGRTDASLEVGFPGDSFQGRYRPARDVQPRYRAFQPQPHYALAAGSLGIMGIGAGEVGIFTRIDGLDLSFSYSRSDDFFGGEGSGDFEFERVGNVRLMLQRQLLPEDDGHSLVLGGWVRHAAVTGGKGVLLDDLRGSEHGASMSYDWRRGDGLSVAATAFAARFAGGKVRLAGDSFGIEASDWKWGIGIKGSYEF